ncbi:MAG TPA: DUF488 domain-containing protein, partial [Vicinamibacterales bacterium]
ASVRDAPARSTTILMTIAAVTLYTIGHGTRSTEDFLAMLRERGIALLIDVRAFPSSRANPQFNKDALAATLAAAGIAYEHWPQLGGRRRGLGDASPNTAWQHPAFRAYADYMMTGEFRTALDSLMARTAERPTAVMCSETLWWRCHRRLIADAAVARGADVLHLMKSGDAKPHALSPHARIAGNSVTYVGDIP